MTLHFSAFVALLCFDWSWFSLDSGNGENGGDRENDEGNGDGDNGGNNGDGDNGGGDGGTNRGNGDNKGENDKDCGDKGGELLFTVHTLLI